ncbi:N-acetylglucosaminyltransferase [Microbulbifer pacificus]|uniref:N-acetylglucosaminyltransferase n=1 Tax=Microbulbifer pacificus TaxID=407164 RepID=A0AAU0N3U4_9GAMM|nr:N-acetylglucosaminyltransferase [Microbulbifer pacificus]WOX06943.1 N-acetylglucosaminyltransferase [Microbulbifer pacificus]
MNPIANIVKGKIPVKGAGGFSGGAALPRRALAVSGALLLTLVTGCATPPPAPAPAPVPPEPVRPTGPSPEEIRQRAVQHFLQRAEDAQREGFITMPAGASAYDFYLQVQQLDPGNAQAAAGIQTLVMQLVEQARDLLRQRAFGHANSLLNTADQIAPGNPLSKEVRSQSQREQRRAEQDIAMEGPGAQTLELPAGPLTARSDTMVQMLKSVAERIRAHELRVIIVARNDAEGRWVYSQLREAVPGYRVRGDIKLGNPPRLLLQKTQ